MMTTRLTPSKSHEIGHSATALGRRHFHAVLAIGLRAVILALLILVAPAAEAAVLCSNPHGHVRIREQCQRHETTVDFRQLDVGDTDPVPLRNWTPAARASTPGLASAASAPDATLLNLSPCRLIDTRPGLSSALSGDDIGAFADFEMRTYTLTGFCGIPDGATSLSINLAVVPGPTSGFASVGPTGSVAAFPPGPDFASINFSGAGPSVSNSLIVPLDDQGRLDVYAAREADVIIDVNGFFQSKDANTNIFFVPGTGTSTENGTALLAAVAEANSLAIGEPSVVRLGPGDFDTGTSVLNMSRPITLVGAGQEATMLTCACASGGVIVATSAGVEIRDLHVDNSGTSVLAGNGISLASFATGAVRDVKITTAEDAGVSVQSDAGVALERVHIIAVNGAVTLSTDPAAVEIRDSTLVGTGFGSTLVVGPDATALIENSTLENLGAFAVVSMSTDSVVDVWHSRLLSASGSYATGAAGTFGMSHSYVDAATSAFSGTATCSGTSGPGVFTATGCP